jgi:hypothetical protein
LLIIQHIWTKWTKEARGANSRLRRPRLAERYPLPEFREAASVLRHEVRALEAEGFAIAEEAGPTDREDWPRLQPYRNNALDWRIRADGVEILLSKPSEYTQQTRWPAQLPRPLFTLREGETARIDWNGRFMSSLSGSNRSSYYEQHTYWLAVAATPSRTLFLEAEPKKHIDFTTGIY